MEAGGSTSRLRRWASADEAMAIGTAGYTAMLCVQAIEAHGIRLEAVAALAPQLLAGQVRGGVVVER